MVYASREVHLSVVKAARLAGIQADRVRLLPTDAQFRLNVTALADAVVADRQAGLRPFLVISSAGTVNTGVIDPLESVGELAAREDLWHHIDGAYGACFYLCPELRPALAGLSRADSLTLDPHKGLFLPYGIGALLVADGTALRAVHGSSAGYLPSTPDADEFYDPSQHGPDLSRGFPGLRLWLCLKFFGAARFRAALLEKHQLAVEAASRIAALEGMSLVNRPALSLFAFHVTWPNASVGEENAATRELLDRIRARGRVFLTGCTIDDRFYARICVLSFRTRREHMETCLEHLEEELATVYRSRRR